jgi:tripartite-type tricarboxylate transporter receptor subunit TctC
VFVLTALAGHAAAPFYEGKTMRIIVGAAPGGGFDTYSRAIARHMGKYIPGHPTIIVENMPGAGLSSPSITFTG